MQYCHKATKRFNALLELVETKRIPLWAHLDLTYRCNLDCIHCYCQNLSDTFSQGHPELSCAEIKRLLDELAEAGSLYLTLSGGEIFLRKDIFEIAAYAKKKNFCLTFFSNGMLIDEQITEKIAALSPLSVELSIYGITAEVHDAVTQRQGSFQKLLNAVRLLKQRQLRVVLKSVIMEKNFQHAGRLELFVSELGADDYQYTMEIAPKNDGSRDNQRQQIDEPKIRQVLKHNLIPLKKAKHEYWDKPLTKPICGTGSIGCYISPYGFVYPCAQLLLPMGNIREKSFKEIWYGNSALQEALAGFNTYGDMADCVECPYVRFCRKCVGLAFLETQDIKKCYNTLKSISKIDYELSMNQEVDSG